MTLKAKIVLAVIGVLALGALLLLSPFVYDGFRSAKQKRWLQSRTDFAEVAEACVTVARSMTNDALVDVYDPRVPELLRSLGPRYIVASTNFIKLEFHGGFDHYGYSVRQSNSNPKKWDIYYYTEDGPKLLTTISKD